ncbi:MAG TPA: purine-nucleoside phosphorylase [Acidimicrobiia bacterium]|nr:purine-nucleoside phosphorylase [Acidimicrobiia bacterium]
MPTPHISADPGDFAETVLLPGDPLRARHVAQLHLEDAREVTAVRGMLGYTGTYRGHRVSVMGTGMGIPSASIYCTELIQEYGVKNLIRIGTCGAMSPLVKVRDIILAMGASTDSGVNRARFDGADFAAIADFGLLRTAVEIAERLGTPIHVGNMYSGDLFYHPDPERFAKIARMGILGAEMEAAGMYGIAAQYGVKALAMCIVSDHLLTEESLSPHERQTAVDAMATLALETAVAVS